MSRDSRDAISRSSPSALNRPSSMATSTSRLLNADTGSIVIFIAVPPSVTDRTLLGTRGPRPEDSAFPTRTQRHGVSPESVSAPSLGCLRADLFEALSDAGLVHFGRASTDVA